MIEDMLRFGSAVVQNSITNEDSTTTLDNTQPFSFFEYLKYASQSATPEEFTSGYSAYLKEWYEVKGVQPQDEADEIKQRYIDLLKEITINYTTAEERRFLSNIDFTSAVDLAIAAPFYAQKIKDICLFFAKKRDVLKYKIEENKIRGTSRSIEKSVFDTIVDYLTLDDSTDDSFYTLATPMSSVTGGMQVETEGYYDVFPNYTNLDPDSESYQDSTDALRIKYFTANTNPISAGMFLGLDSQIMDDIFKHPIFLTELAGNFTINADLAVQNSLDIFQCSPTELAAMVGSDVGALSSLYNLKKKLIQKFIGVDFYYLSTNSSSQQISGLLFKATNPSGNLLNKRFATTISVPENDLRTARQLGILLNPDKLGTLQFDTPSKSYFVDESKLSPNKTYIFPDPTIYGNVTNLIGSNLEYPLTFVIDNTGSVKMGDYGAAAGNVKNTPYTQSFYAYYNDPIYVDSRFSNISGNDNNMLRIFDRGIFSEYAFDVYGNEYGLLKDVSRFERSITDTKNLYVRNLILDGYEFNDIYEGFNFNYATVDDDYYGFVRSGMTAKTTDLFPPGSGAYVDGTYTAPSANMFYLTGAPIYSLYFRQFSPYEESSIDQINYSLAVRDGAFFTAIDNSIYPDVSSDLPIFDIGSYVYYNLLVDAALSASFVMNPPTTVPAFSAIFTAVPTFSSILFELFDCLYFSINVELDNDKNYTDSLYFIDDVSPQSATVLATSATPEDCTISYISGLSGCLLVKNIATNTVMPASGALANIFSKYDTSVKNDMNGCNVKSFNIFYDTIAIKTSSNLLFDKIVMDNNSFTKPGTTNNVISLSSGNFDTVSNLFFLENRNEIIFCTTSLLLNSLSSYYTKTVYPHVYKFNIVDNTLSTLYNSSTGFSIGLSAIDIVRIKNTNIAHNSRNNRYSITWIGYDLNNAAYVFNSIFSRVGNTMTLNDFSVHTIDSTVTTYNFHYGLSAFTNLQQTTSNNSLLSARGDILYFN